MVADSEGGGGENHPPAIPVQEDQFNPAWAALVLRYRKEIITKY
jgi:hypothetical protein